MRPVNEKSLLHYLFEQMDKLDRNEITEQKAAAISKLASQATRLYELEQKRAIIQIQLQQMGYSDIEIRELSSKGFDDTTKKLIDSTEY